MYSLSGRECFFYVIRHWKRIIVIILLGALAIGAYKGAKEIVHWSENKSIQEQAALCYDRDYAYVSSLAVFYNKQIEEEQAILEGLKDFSINSSVDDLNSETLYLVEAELMFDSTLPDGSFYPVDIAIVEEFNQQINVSVDWNVVAAAGDVDLNTARCMFFSSVNSENTSINLKVYASDSQSGSDMLATIVASCEALESDFETTYVGLHMNVSEQSSKVADPRQVNVIYNNIAERIIESEDHITQLQNSVNALSYPQEPSNMPYGLQVGLKVAKYMVLGAAIGFCSAIVLLYLSFYMNGRVHSEEEYEHYVKSFVITMWIGGNPSRGLSHLIADKENHGLIYDCAETVDRLLANIASSEPGVSRVVFTTSGAEEELNSIREYVKNSNHSIKNFVFAPDILRDTEALSALEQGSEVVLVEYIDKCPVSLLKKEVEQIKLSGSRIVGAVLLR